MSETNKCTVVQGSRFSAPIALFIAGAVSAVALFTQLPMERKQRDLSQTAKETVRERAEPSTEAAIRPSILSRAQQSTPSTDTSHDDKPLANVVIAQEELVLPAEAIVRKVAWPRGPVDGALVAALSPPVREAVGRSFVPVLFPADPTLAQRAFLLMRSTGYSAVVDGVFPGIQLSIRSEAICYGCAENDVGERWTESANGFIRSSRARVTKTEMGWSLSWLEFGITYEVVWGCTSRETEYCTPEFAKAICDQLAYVGGRGARG